MVAEAADVAKDAAAGPARRKQKDLQQQQIAEAAALSPLLTMRVGFDPMECLLRDLEVPLLRPLPPHVVAPCALSQSTRYNLLHFAFPLLPPFFPSQANLSKHAVFFADRHGGTVVGMVWRPAFARALKDAARLKKGKGAVAGEGIAVGDGNEAGSTARTEGSGPMAALRAALRRIGEGLIEEFFVLPN